MLLNAWLKLADRRLEWGSGRSSTWIAEPVAHLVTVQHDPVWHAKVKADFAARGLAEKVACRLVTCGHIVEHGGVKVTAKRLATVLKIDIEGAAFTVIPEQIDELIQARTWIVEIHPGMVGDPAVVTGAFRDRGYDLWWAEPSSDRFQPYAGEPWTARTTLIARL